MSTATPVDLATKITVLEAPRSPRGRRHSLAGVLLTALSAILAGVRCLRTIGQWADAAPGTPWPA